MTDNEKLNQHQFLVKKALVTIEQEKQELFNSKQDYLNQRNELERKLVDIYEIFFKGETYIFHSLSTAQYESLIEKLKQFKE